MRIDAGICGNRCASANIGTWPSLIRTFAHPHFSIKGKRVSKPVYIRPEASKPLYIRLEAPKLIQARHAPGKTQPKAEDFVVCYTKIVWKLLTVGNRLSVSSQRIEEVSLISLKKAWVGNESSDIKVSVCTIRLMNCQRVLSWKCPHQKLYINHHTCMSYLKPMLLLNSFWVQIYPDMKLFTEISSCFPTLIQPNPSLTSPIIPSSKRLIICRKNLCRPRRSWPTSLLFGIGQNYLKIVATLVSFPHKYHDVCTFVSSRLLFHISSIAVAGPVGHSHPLK